MSDFYLSGLLSCKAWLYKMGNSGATTAEGPQPLHRGRSHCTGAAATTQELQPLHRGRSHCTGAAATAQGQQPLHRGRSHCTGAVATAQGPRPLDRGCDHYTGAAATAQGPQPLHRGLQRCSNLLQSRGSRVVREYYEKPSTRRWRKLVDNEAFVKQRNRTDIFPSELMQNNSSEYSRVNVGCIAKRGKTVAKRTFHTFAPRLKYDLIVFKIVHMYCYTVTNNFGTLISATELRGSVASLRVKWHCYWQCQLQGSVASLRVKWHCYWQCQLQGSVASLRVKWRCYWQCQLWASVASLRVKWHCYWQCQLRGSVDSLRVK